MDIFFTVSSSRYLLGLLLRRGKLAFNSRRVGCLLPPFVFAVVEYLVFCFRDLLMKNV